MDGGRGRGRGYTVLRAASQAALAVLYRGGWPARLWGLVPGSVRVAVAQRRVTVPGRGTGRCRVAFVSDLHLGPTTPEAVVERAFAVLRDAVPDVLLLGGDYFHHDPVPRTLARLTELVSAVAAPLTLAVLGNHDLWADERAIAAALVAGGARVLVNESVRFAPPWDDVTVIALDDPRAGSPDAAAAFAGTLESAFRLVLCHGPDGLAQLVGRRFDAYVCGHTHGGQLATPWGPILPGRTRLTRRYWGGFDRFEDAWIFVSRGIGGAEVPVRLWATPDVLILDLERANPS